MRDTRQWWQDPSDELEAERPEPVAPGKASLTQRLHARDDAPPASALHPLAVSMARPIQLRVERGAVEDPFAVHQLAEQGVRGAGQPLPHLDAIQASFGHHDVTGVRAHVDGPARDATTALGAQGYATGDAVAFAGAPDLHTAAHEAAHVVQQRGGVRLAGGVGQVGDPYEQHADAVADRVVRGQSAQDLLDAMAHRGAAGGKAVQGRAVQLRVRQSDDAAVATYRRLMASTSPAEARDLRAALDEALEHVATMQIRVGVSFQHRGETYQLEIPVADARRLQAAAPSTAGGDAAGRAGGREADGGRAADERGAAGGRASETAPTRDAAPARGGDRAATPDRGRAEERTAPRSGGRPTQRQVTFEFPDREFPPRPFAYVTVTPKIGGQVVVSYAPPAAAATTGGGGSGGGGEAAGGEGPGATDNVTVNQDGLSYQRQVQQEINQRILGFTPSVGAEVEAAGDGREAHFGVGGQLQAPDDAWGVRQVSARIDLASWDRESGRGLRFFTGEVETQLGMPPFRARIGDWGECLIEPALTVTFELAPNWPAIGRQLLAQLGRAGLVAAEGSLAAEAGMATSLAGPAFAAALGIGAGVAIAYIAYRELSAADEMERVTHVLPDHLYYFCLSYTAQFFGRSGFSGSHGEAGREAGQAALRRIATDNRMTVDEVIARARTEGARAIYTSIYEQAGPRYRDEAADRMGSRVRYAPLIQGCLPRARWGGETFNRRGGARGLPEHGVVATGGGGGGGGGDAAGGDAPRGGAGRSTQRAAAGPGGADPSPGAVQAVADRGVAGGGEPLPHLAAIQASFGRHDVTGVRAHTGEEAAAAAHAIGARAYATGDDVAFAGAPDLHTAAHEAAHVVQQRAGVHLASGVGQTGDVYERHADAVADAVVRGEPAEALLDQHAGAGGGGVQRAVQLRRFVGTSSPDSVRIVQELLADDNVTAMNALLRAMRQVAARRTESGGTERVMCTAGGHTFELTLAAEDSDQLQPMIERRVGQLQAAARASATRPRGAEAEGDEVIESSEENEGRASLQSGGGRFADAFNARFREVLPALRQAGRDSSGPDDRSPTFTEAELRLMFTPGQRVKLERYFATGVIPDRLFEGGDAGSCNAQQRIVLSGYILSHGTYEPGSFAQDLHARMCGHWAQLVHNYAGVARTGAEGVQGEFDHDQQLVLGAGASQRVYDGTQDRLDPSEQTGQRRFRRRGMPLADFDQIQPGDWLYIHTEVDTPGGDHSVVFSHWLDTAPRGPAGAQYRRAITFDQSSPDRGGQQHTRYLGATRGTADGNPIYPITWARRYDADARAPETPDDVIANDLGLDPEQRRRALMPELGTGPAAQANLDIVLRMERRHHGRLQVPALRERLREINRGLIERINPSASDPGTAARDHADESQLALLRETNERDDIETLVRLNERLDNIVHNAGALEQAEQAQADRYEAPEREQMRAEAAERRAEIQGEIDRIDEEIARADAVLSVDQEIRSLERERSGLRRSMGRSRPQLRTARGPRREQIEAHLRTCETRLAALEEELASLAGRRGAAAATEEAQRETTDLGRGLSVRSRRARLAARRTRKEREATQVWADAGYYTAHPGSRDTFLGRRDGQREARLTGRLDHVRPELPWAELITPGEPGSAQEAQQRQRDARRRRR